MTDNPADEHVVHEAFGPSFSPVEAGAAIAIGVVSLLIAGVLAVLLGGLADEHRLSSANIGIAAALEAVTMGVVTGLAGVVLKARRLRLLGVCATLALALIDLATIQLHDNGILAIRALAGVPEGLLLWITIGMIARTEVPERWSGVLFTALTAATLAVAVAFTVWVLPRFGANGGFVFLAVVSLAGLVIARFLPDRYPPLPEAGRANGGAPPLRGWIALIATLIFVSSTGAVGIYLEPLAHQAGLSAGVAQTALSVGLAAQLPGAALATAVAGRVRYYTIFLIGTAVALATWAIYGFAAPAWLFIAATAAQGFIGIFVTPFLVPMTIEADPSRRAAVQSGAAQLLGGAFGPLVASMAVDDHHARGTLYLGAALILAGTAIITWLRFTARSSATAETAGA
jgi:predicted MFS family arabinose efflux permease